MADDKELFNISERSDVTPSVSRPDMFVDIMQELRAPTPPSSIPAVPTPEIPHVAGSIGSEFVDGLRAGWSQVGTDLRATAAMGLQVLGYEKDALDLMKVVLSREESDAREFPKAIQRVEDIESIGELAKWAARSLGEQVPNIASIFLGGGGANILGRMVGKGAISLGAAPQLVAKFPVIFTGVGTVGTTTAIETGGTAAEIFAATGRLEPGIAFTAGITKGALEALTPMMLGARLGLGSDITRSLTNRVMSTYEKLLPGRLGTAIGIGSTEMVTEVLQEAVDIAARGFVDEHYDLLGADVKSRILNAAAGGLFVGSVFGLASRGNRSQTRLEERQSVMPPEFAAESPDISIGEDATGLPAQITIRPGQEPEDLPRVTQEVYALASGLAVPSTPEGWTVAETASEPVTHSYDPTKPPSPENSVGPYKSVEEFVSQSARTPGVPVTAAAILHHYLNKFNTDPNLYVLDKYGQRAPYAPGAHVLGKTEIIYNEARRRQATGVSFIKKQQIMQRVKVFLDREMQKIGMNERLLLFEGSMDKPYHADYPGAFTVKAWAHLNPFEDMGFIGIDFDRINKLKAQGMSLEHATFLAAAHEFGHFISYTRFAKASSDIQARIRAQYERDLVHAAFGDTRYMGPFINPDFMAIAGDSPRLDKSNAGSSETRNYRYSFEEWFAENVAKYYSESYGQQPPLISDNVVRKFFRDLARDIKALFERLNGWLGVNTNQPIREFMDSLRRTHTPVQQKSSIFQSAMQAGEAKGIRENTEILKDFTNDEFIPPPQPGTGGMYNLIKKFLPAKAAREIRAFADKFNWFMDLFFNIQQIGQHNPHIKPLQRYLELADQWYNFQMNWMGRADERVREWLALGKHQQQSLTQLIFAVDAMEYLTPDEISKGVVRQPTNGELAGLAGKYGVTPGGFQVFQKIREDFAAVLDQIEQTSLRDIDRTITDPITNASEKANITREMAALRARPYFPHARFGDWSVVVKDKQGGKTIHMDQFESKIAANLAAPELLRQAQKEFPGAIARVDYIPKEVQGFRGLPPNLIARIKERLKLSEVQTEWLDNLIVNMAQSASFRHHLQKRMNTPGFSRDAIRAYASYFFHGARHLARIEYGPLMQEEVTSGMNDSIGMLESPGVVVDVAKRRRIQEYMANHLEHILNPKPDWHQLKSLAFQWYLGFNVSSAALNITQPVLVGYPFLAARFGDGKTASAMMKAVKDIQNVYKFRETDRVPDALFKALDRAMKEGIVEESQAAELASTAQGAYISRLLPGTKLQRFVQQMAHYSSWMFQQSERLNRRIMFRAAWQLAMENRDTQYLDDLVTQNQIAVGEMLNAGFDIVEARAYLAARDAVRRTQFQYAQHARPKFMRGKKGVVFTFFMFTQSMLHFAAYDPGRVRYLVLMLAMAGMMGLPGAEDLEAIAKLLARNILGKDFDVQREVRELVLGMFGDAIPPDLLLHGVGRVGFGLPALMDLLGLPKPQFDFSRRIGFGRILPGVAELGAPGLDFDEAMSRVSTQAAGAAFGIGFNIIKALSDDTLPFDDFKRWERALPTSLGNLARTLRYAAEGRERSRTDATIVDYNITDPDHIAELALRAIGFNPTRVQREWDRIKMQREAEAYWTARRAIVLKLWSHSFGLRDSELRESALNDVKRYNAEVPFGSMRITGEQLAKSRTEHLRQIRLREAGITRTKAMRPLAREISSLHPETRQSAIIDVEDASRLR